MNNHLLWTYEEQNNPTIAQLANRMGTSEYQARKAKGKAEKKGLIVDGRLTKLGRLIIDNLNNPIIQDYLAEKVTPQTVAVLAYNCRRQGESTRNIPRLAVELKINVDILLKYLYRAESQELLGVSRYADLNNITYRNGWGDGDVLEAVLNRQQS